MDAKERGKEPQKRNISPDKYSFYADLELARGEAEPYFEVLDFIEQEGKPPWDYVWHSQTVQHQETDLVDKVIDQPRIVNGEPVLDESGQPVTELVTVEVKVPLFNEDGQPVMRESSAFRLEIIPDPKFAPDLVTFVAKLSLGAQRLETQTITTNNSDNDPTPIETGVLVYNEGYAPEEVEKEFIDNADSNEDEGDEDEDEVVEDDEIVLEPGDLDYDEELNEEALKKREKEETILAEARSFLGILARGTDTGGTRYNPDRGKYYTHAIGYDSIRFNPGANRIEVDVNNTRTCFTMGPMRDILPKWLMKERLVTNPGTNVESTNSLVDKGLLPETSRITDLDNPFYIMGVLADKNRPIGTIVDHDTGQTYWLNLDQLDRFLNMDPLSAKALSGYLARNYPGQIVPAK